MWVFKDIAHTNILKNVSKICDLVMFIKKNVFRDELNHLDYGFVV